MFPALSLTRPLAAFLLAMIVVAHASSALAIDFYEIQIYSNETVSQGHLQLELHSNSTTTAVGREAHQVMGPYEVRETLEASYGILPWAEIGQYLATAKMSNGNYEYAGARSKLHFAIPQTVEWPVSFGGNIELDYMRFAAEDQPLTLEIRPIAETHWRRWRLIGNFAFEKPFSGSGTHQGVTLAPSGELEYERLFEWLSPALEYYGDLGPVREPSHPQHFLFPAANLDLLKGLELNFAVGFGLTRASNGVITKMIIGYTF